MGDHTPAIGASSLDVDIERRVGDFHLRAKFRADAGLTAFFGRSGSGKTSLANAIAGLDRPDAGHISVGDTVLFDADSGIHLPPERRRIGYVFQESRLFPHMTVRGNLDYGRRFVPSNEPQHDFEMVVDLLDLTSLLQRHPEKLSGGEKQRVAIGRALLAAPRLLLMDEPLASLDDARKAEILPFIERLRDHLALPIVYVSHAMEEVIRLADTMVIIDGGATVAAGSVEEIMSRLDLRPLTGRYEAGAVLPVTVRGHDSGFGLTELGFGEAGLAGRLWVPRIDLPLGSAIRMRIRARDVSLSLTKPTDTSILNIFEGTITEIAADDGPQAEILVDIGVPIIARVTRKSIAALDLKPGATVFTMIKAAAIDRHNLGLAGANSRARID
mgnify:CR=1 FL=1